MMRVDALRCSNPSRYNQTCTCVSSLICEQQDQQPLKYQTGRRKSKSCPPSCACPAMALGGMLPPPWERNQGLPTTDGRHGTGGPQAPAAPTEPQPALRRGKAAVRWCGGKMWWPDTVPRGMQQCPGRGRRWDFCFSRDKSIWLMAGSSPHKEQGKYFGVYLISLRQNQNEQTKSKLRLWRSCSEPEQRQDAGCIVPAQHHLTPAKKGLKPIEFESKLSFWHQWLCSGMSQCGGCGGYMARDDPVHVDPVRTSTKQTQTQDITRATGVLPAEHLQM